jgi:serine/arginine repetitive matrix protein 1
MSGNAFRGVSAEQDARFGDKEKKLLKAMAKSFPEEYKTKVDLLKVNWEAMKPWIANRLTELLGGVEDDVLIGYVYEQLEGKKEVDPRLLQINLTGFLENNTRRFCKELWTLLISAASGPSGIPQQFLDAKAAELQQREAERRIVQERIATERARRTRIQEEEQEAAWERRRRRRDRDRDRDGDDQHVEHEDEDEDERSPGQRWRRGERHRSASASESPSPERRRRYRRHSTDSRDRFRGRRSPGRNWDRSRQSGRYSRSPPHRRYRRRSPSYD